MSSTQAFFTHRPTVRTLLLDGLARWGPRLRAIPDTVAPQLAYAAPLTVTGNSISVVFLPINSLHFAADDSLAFRLMRTTVVGSQCCVDSKARVYLKLTATCHHSHNSRCIVTWDGLKAGGLLGWPNFMRGHFRFGYPWKKDVVQHEILPFFRV